MNDSVIDIYSLLTNCAIYFWIPARARISGLILVCQKCTRSKTKKSKGGGAHMPQGYLSPGMARGFRNQKSGIETGRNGAR